MNTKKQEIIKWLKQLGRLPTTRIMSLIGLDFNYTKKYLNELESEKIIIKESETNATYWKLNKKEVKK